MDTLFVPQPNVFYNFSGGMESAAMLVLERDRIRETEAIIVCAHTGKQFPEFESSIEQIEKALGVQILIAPRRITFDEFLFERGGMLRKGTTDCSRRMKRANLAAFHHRYRKPWEINLGFNAGEQERADSFTARNERDWCHWRFPLIEHSVERAETVEICKRAGFSILVGMYEKMGRFDCFWCPNQRPAQALKVVEHYPELAAEWMAAEERKGHSFLPIPLKMLVERAEEDLKTATGCSCFGGTDDVWEGCEEEEPACS